MKLVVEYDVIHAPKHIAAIRCLLAAVLERAIYDLESGSYVDTKNALQWFKARGGIYSEKGFSFELVVNILQLSAERLAKIEIAVKEAEGRRALLAKLPGKQRCKRGLFVVSDNYSAPTIGGLVLRKAGRRRVNVV